MWKVGVDHPDFPESFTTLRQTWLDKSPEYEYIVKTNAECDAMIAELYADVPEIIHAYNIMPEVILQCDLGRYLILYAYGGIYTDLDTKLLKPIEDWFSSQESYLNKTLNLGLVVGIESDRPDWKTCCARRLQIQTWTIMARKGHPFLAELINSIVEHTLWREETGQLGVRMGRDASDNVINWTGPGRFTDFTFKYINNVLQTDFDNYETVINESFLTQTKLPIIIGDAMILPEECMHPTKKSKKGEFIDPRAHVRHVGSNVWKTDQKNKNKNKEGDKKKEDKKVDDKKADKKVDDKKADKKVDDKKVDKQEKPST
ncbi:uncharacterized protein SPAPADRAFT_59962 [Spathaspora passalidarum NRRL Y-27907]|uniref:Initiation-specific alpha-1,6-mannosyltransferase n=1 Tax=Spathaspora passalidarum (strain NRRL Y-27907 / 11-Y1) TaxID=619300 RepID=G3AJ18_SPAPN|nr:uncharacterized protein SPAPADRAFT_59962 [Spathaspora passalidarum NRRL Y-27907]EGW34530.1 hypothetical protein SPAPADRAFT_59962 [Spathaspora passalidarum NRRL Y-27907]